MCRWHIATAVARPQARNPTASAKKNYLPKYEDFHTAWCNKSLSYNSKFILPNTVSAVGSVCILEGNAI